MERVKTERHHRGFRLLHWMFFCEGVLLTLTGIQIGGLFNFKLLPGGTLRATHVTFGLACIMTCGLFVYYLLITKDYKWYGLRRIPYSIRFFFTELKAWFGRGPHVKEPIRYDPDRDEYVEKLIPTVIMVWWMYVIIGLGLFLTGLAMAFPENFGFVTTLADPIGSLIMGVGGYPFIRAIHRLLMFILVGIVLIHAYAAWVFSSLRGISFGDRNEPVGKVGEQPTPGQDFRGDIAKMVYGVEQPIANWLQRRGIVKKILNWGRAYSPWPIQYGIGCCMTEGAAVMANRWDIERFGLLPLFGPRQTDVLMISGAVNKKMLPRLLRIYEQMPDPKYVICFGACAMSGGAFWDNYSLVHPISDYIPVDVFVPGCPPKPDDLVRGFMLLEEKIRKGDTYWDKTYRQ